jgi:TonB-linked SusC/RagA family outer membrane protein
MIFFTIPASHGEIYRRATERVLPNNRLSRFLIRTGILSLIILLSASPIFAQQMGSIKGKVIDNEGVTIPGVGIKLEGPVNQTQSTDAAGNYSFTNLSAGTYTVSFSFVGMAPFSSKVTLRAGEQHVLNPKMESQTGSLDEVVVVAYGTQKKSSLTAAITTIKGEKIANLPVANISNALGGRMPGLITKQVSGEPGNDQAQMFIRGISTTGSSAPLLVVDGIPRNFTNLDPQTIETITILKDAAAVAPYGVAGGNGVILVTTKTGKTGSPNLSFNSSYGVMNLTNIPELPTSYEFAQLKNAAAANEGLPPVYTAAELELFQNGSDPDKYPNTNAHDIMIDPNTPQTLNSIQISGGADKIKYFASLGHMFQQGIFKPIKAERYTLSANLDAEVTPSTTMSLKLNARQQNNSYSGIRTSDLFVFLNYALPVQPIFWSNGQAATYVYPIIHESGSNTSQGSQIFSQLSLNQKLNFIPGLSFTGTIGYDPTFNSSKQWVTPTHVWAGNLTAKPYVFTDAIYGDQKAKLTQVVSNPVSLTYQTQLDYSRNFGKSNGRALALFEARETNSTSLTAARVNYNLLVDELSVGSSNPLDISNLGSSSRSTQMGMVSRLSYGYDDKYFVEATGRYDGHYYFAPGKKFGFFPAVSLGWRLSQERFFKNALPFVSNFKLRGSYGIVGSLAGNPFQYLSTYDVNSNVAVLGGTAVQGIAERAEPNKNITWEKAMKTDIGFDASFWNDLLTIEFDYFYEKRSNMLLAPTVTVPVEYGNTLSQVNSAKMSNKGFDVIIGSMHNFSKDLQVSLSANVTHAKNKVLEIFETASTFNNPNLRLTGRPLGVQFGYDAVGFYLPDDFTATGALKPGIVTGPTTAKLFPGDLKYRDVNGDSKIDQNDRVQIGNAPTAPRFMYGFNPNVRYKAFSLDLLFQGAYKVDKYMSDWVVWPFNVGRGAYKHNLNYWRPDNLNALNPRITSAPAANNTQVSSWWISDASYLRLKNIQLSYSLPQSLISKVGMRSASFMVSAQNLKTWSNMKWDYDPETPSATNSANLGAYPSEQVISMGINVSFK